MIPGVCRDASRPAQIGQACSAQRPSLDLGGIITKGHLSKITTVSGSGDPPLHKCRGLDIQSAQYCVMHSQIHQDSSVSTLPEKDLPQNDLDFPVDPALLCTLPGLSWLAPDPVG